WWYPSWTVDGRECSVDLPCFFACGSEPHAEVDEYVSIPMLYGEGRDMFPIQHTFEGEKLVAPLPGRIVIRFVRPAGADVKMIWITARSRGDRKYDWSSDTTAT